jgi:hypothetical protein
MTEEEDPELEEAIRMSLQEADLLLLEREKQALINFDEVRGKRKREDDLNLLYEEMINERDAKRIKRSLEMESRLESQKIICNAKYNAERVTLFTVELILMNLLSFASLEVIVVLSRTSHRLYKLTHELLHTMSFSSLYIDTLSSLNALKSWPPSEILSVLRLQITSLRLRVRHNPWIETRSPIPSKHRRLKIKSEHLANLETLYLNVAELADWKAFFDYYSVIINWNLSFSMNMISSTIIVINLKSYKILSNNLILTSSMIPVDAYFMPHATIYHHSNK